MTYTSTFKQMLYALTLFLGAVMMVAGFGSGKPIGLLIAVGGFILCLIALKPLEGPL